MDLSAIQAVHQAAAGSLSDTGSSSTGAN